METVLQMLGCWLSTGYVFVGELSSVREDPPFVALLRGRSGEYDNAHGFECASDAAADRGPECYVRYGIDGEWDNATESNGG